MDDLIAKIADPDAAASRVEKIRKEIGEELRIETLDRFASFLQKLDDEQSTVEDKLALAVSGWIIGSDNAIAKLPPALSLYQVRERIKEYLNNSNEERNGSRFSTAFSPKKAPSPTNVIEILSHAKPFYDLPDPVAEDKPGYFKLEVPGMAEGCENHLLGAIAARVRSLQTLSGRAHAQRRRQHRRKSNRPGGPAIGRTASGSARRRGTATSSIAPEWTAEHQKDYGYSAREHAVVLNSLRDACRRFSIDTDRVYLTGHSMGGDAAWDIGLAHPDLWAGVIPISASVDRYCTLYWENAKYVPFYFVIGELDGSRLAKNARDLDRYLQRGFDTTVVEYQGRGHEDYFDEILRMFDWMGRFRRNFYPREFTCCDDAAVGQLFLVDRDGRHAAEIDGRSRQLAAAVRHAADEGRMQDHRSRIRSSSRAGACASQRLALAGDDRFQAAGEHSGQRQADERERSLHHARLEDDSRRRPHPRRPPASVLGEIRRHDGQRAREVTREPGSN